MPIVLRVEVDTEDTRKFRGKLRWLYGLVNVDLAKKRKNSKQDADDRWDKTEAREENVASSSKRAKRFMWAMLRSEGFLARSLSLVRAFFSLVHISDSRLYVRFGLDNPADTGVCLAYIIPIFELLQRPAFSDAQLESDFEREVMILRAKTTVTLVPLQYLGALASFLFSREFIRGVRRGIQASYA